MGILATIGKSLLGGGIGQGATRVADAIDRFVETPEEKQAAEILKTKIRQQPDAWQVEINKIEAAHSSVFVAGWRPAIGWVCGISLGAYFIPQYVLAAILWIKMCWVASTLIPYPVDSEALMKLIFALLGMGTLRTIEKGMNKAR